MIILCYCIILTFVTLKPRHPKPFAVKIGHKDGLRWMYAKKERVLRSLMGILKKNDFDVITIIPRLSYTDRIDVTIGPKLLKISQ